MKYKALLLVAAIACSSLLFGQSKPSIDLKINEAEKKVDVLVDGNLFTSYIYPSNIMKPVLWPVMSPAGNMLTRSYGMVNKAGDRSDHPHHIGVWLNYGDVNGLDFWNNSDAIKPERKDRYGSIYHKSVDRIESIGNKATLEVSAEWKSPANE